MGRMGMMGRAGMGMAGRKEGSMMIRAGVAKKSGSGVSSGWRRRMGGSGPPTRPVPCRRPPRRREPDRLPCRLLSIPKQHLTTYPLDRILLPAGLILMNPGRCQRSHSLIYVRG